MGKPWAKTEIDFINHPKFRTLKANAICLWIEGKNYCDKHMTDGLIPAHEAKRFRFHGLLAVESLLASCGPKNETQTYAPLWEVHPVGFKMHDYLAHNDCREVVLARIEQADRDKELDRSYKAGARAAKKAKREEALSVAVLADVRSDVRPDKPDASGPCPPKVRLYTETATTTETDPLPKNGNGGSAPPALRPRPLAPIHDTSHRKHAVCGRVCLHASLFNDFVRRRNHALADQEIRTWAEGVVDEWTTGVFQTIEPGDSFDFWKARYAEQWPAALVAAPSKSKLPAWAQS